MNEKQLRRKWIDCILEDTSGSFIDAFTIVCTEDQPVYDRELQSIVPGKLIISMSDPAEYFRGVNLTDSLSGRSIRFLKEDSTERQWEELSPQLQDTIMTRLRDFELIEKEHAEEG